MTKPTSPSSATSPTPETGATDALWQPSWWQWLAFALSGTVETNRNRETDRLAAAEYRRIEEEQRRIEAEEQTARRARIEAERDLALLNYLIDPSDRNRAILAQVRDLIQEYRDTLS